MAGVGEAFVARVMHRSAKAERRHVQIPLWEATACRVRVLVSNVAVVGYQLRRGSSQLGAVSGGEGCLT